MGVDPVISERLERAVRAMAAEDLDAWLELHHPDAEIIPFIVAVEGHPYRGYGEMREFWREMHESFEEWHPEVEEIEALGALYLIRLRFRGRGRDSGVTIDQPVWQLVRVRDDRAEWWRIFGTEAEAREFAAGQ